MPLKIVLVNVNTCASPYPVFPLGIAHLAGFLQSHGVACEIVDPAAEGEEMYERISSANPDYVGLSLRNIDDIHIDDTAFYAPALAQVARRVRALTDAPVIVGGSGYSLFPRELLELSGADFGVVGEGESALSALLQALSSGGDYAAIPGLVYRGDDGVVVNPMKPAPAEQICAPSIPGHLARFYLRESTMLSIQTQRGCNFTCSYCTYPLIEGRRFRRRSPESVCDDIDGACRAGARYVFIVDSVFNTSETHVAGICEEILRRDIDIEWGCFLRPQGLTQQLMDLMARAGLRHIEFGSDSLCDSVLEAYGKGFAFDDVLRASECAGRARVHYAHFLIIGGPTETEATIRESYDNSRRLKHTVFFPFIGVRLYPNTPLHATALREGVVSDRSDLFAPYFYLSPGVSRERIRELLNGFHAESQNWIIDDITVEHRDVMEGLRRIGVVGPMWEFLIR